MKAILLLCGGLLTLVPAGWGQYKDKPDTNAPFPAEQIPFPGNSQRQHLPVGDYPYYGNVPEELMPYHNVEPFYQYWLTRLPFRGPGRDFEDPPNLKAYKIGLLSPAPYGSEAKRGQLCKMGVTLAFEEVNAARPPGSLPFELIEKMDSPQWGSAANIAVEFADNQVLAFIGTIDGDATHVALRVALKIETLMINCSDPDPTLTETQIPWLLRVFPDNRQQGFRLASLIVEERGLNKIVVLRANNRPGRIGVRPFVDSVRRLGHPVLQEINFLEGDRTFDTQVSVIKQAQPDAVVFWGNPAEIGPAAAQLRKAGVKAAFFGFDRILDADFIEAAGSAAEGVTVTYFFDPNKADAAWTSFAQRFQKRFGIKPDIYAGYNYDGAQLLIKAIQKAGPNRYRIRDAVADLENYQGVTGFMRFDGRWDNVTPIVTAQYKLGKWWFEASPRARQAKAEQ